MISIDGLHVFVIKWFILKYVWCFIYANFIFHTFVLFHKEFAVFLSIFTVYAPKCAWAYDLFQYIALYSLDVIINCGDQFNACFYIWKINIFVCYWYR